MDVFFDYENAKKIVDEIGWEGFVQLIESKYNKKFFSCSTHWYENKKYICKLKGAHGDIIIRWTNN